MAESIIGSIRDGFVVWQDTEPNSFEFSDKHFLEIIKELETDRDRLMRILSVLEDERQTRSSELSATHQTHG